MSYSVCQLGPSVGTIIWRGTRQVAPPPPPLVRTLEAAAMALRGTGPGAAFSATSDLYRGVS
jgi:hypothetical protein